MTRNRSEPRLVVVHPKDNYYSVYEGREQLGGFVTTDLLEADHLDEIRQQPRQLFEPEQPKKPKVTFPHHNVINLPVIWSNGKCVVVRCDVVIGDSEHIITTKNAASHELPAVIVFKAGVPAAAYILADYEGYSCVLSQAGTTGFTATLINFEPGEQDATDPVISQWRRPSEPAGGGEAGGSASVSEAPADDAGSGTAAPDDGPTAA